MDNIFHTLVQRSSAQKETTFGDPWQVIPIKNFKQAKDTTELHLSNRGIDKLIEFHHFPNIEVLWLNDNKGIDTNFRIKHLYIYNNKIQTLEGSLRFLKHIETLLISKNELRDLDKNLSYLVDFTHLSTLDFFGNPVAEETNYRLRVIQALPTLKLLDRHIITIDERRKAKELYEIENGIKKKKDSKKLRIPLSATFSKGEKDLYREVDKVKTLQKQRQDDKDELERKINAPKTWKIAEKMPKSKIQEDLERRRATNPFSVISEFEKNKFRTIFKSLDPKKDAKIPISSLNDVYDQLMQDNALIGKIPDCRQDQFVNLVRGDREDFINWDDFRFQLNYIEWTKPDKQLTEKRINEFYYNANVMLHQGKKEKVTEELAKAIRLESQMQAEENPFNLSYQPPQKEKVIVRKDVFDFDRFKVKKQFTETAKIII